MMLDSEPISSGLASLDYILNGGYERRRSHLIEGQPGCGKTTLAMQFLIAGRDKGERCLFVTMSESPEELRQAANAHGLSLDGIELFECTPPQLVLDPDQYQSVVHAADLELGEMVRSILAAVNTAQPSLIVLDSLSELRMMAQGAVRYRRQVMALKHFFLERGCTVLFLDDQTMMEDSLTLHSIAHGVVRLEQLAMEYGAERRRLRVIKMRGRSFRGGYHDFMIAAGGLRVFPRLISPAPEIAPDVAVPLSTGNPALDLLIGGGLEGGTTTLIQGASGTGKSTLGLQCIHGRLESGQRALFVSFEESLRNFQSRAASVGLPIEKYLENGLLTFVNVDPAETSAGQISDMVRQFVAQGTCSVILDSLSGYLHALRDENYLMLHMHELLTYLNLHNVVTIVVLAQAGVGGTLEPPIELTYLADTVLLLRFFEAAGEMRRALAVVKKRTGQHEQTMREMFLDVYGLQLGPPLTSFDSIFSAHPVYTGDANGLLSARKCTIAA